MRTTQHVNETKSKLANDFLEELKQAGTRLLQQVDNRRHLTCIITEGTWIEVDDDVALEKIKQAFRQRRPKGKPTNEGKDQRQVDVPEESNSGVHGENPSTLPSTGTFLNPPAGVGFGSAGGSVARIRPFETISPSGQVLPATLPGTRTLEAAAVDPPHCLIQRDFVTCLQQPVTHQLRAAAMRPSNGTLSVEHMARIAQQDLMRSQIQDMRRAQGCTATSANADMAALEYIQHYMNDDQFQETLNQVQAKRTQRFPRKTI